MANELTVTAISALHDIFLETPEMDFRVFAEVYKQIATNSKVDDGILRLIFELIDENGNGFITWTDFQNHLAVLRRDEQIEQQFLKEREYFHEMSRPEETVVPKELHHSASIKRIIKHPKMEMLMTCGLDGSVRLWDSNSLDPISTMHYAPCGGIDMDYDPHSDIAVVATADQVISLYTMENQKLIRTYKIGKDSKSERGVEDEVYRRQFRVPKPTPKYTFNGVPDPEMEGSILARYWNAKHNMLLQRVWARKKFLEKYPATMLPETKGEITSVSGCKTTTMTFEDVPQFITYIGQKSGGLHLYKCRYIKERASEELQKQTGTMEPVAKWMPHASEVTCIRTDRDAEVVVTGGADSDIHIVHMERGTALRTLHGTKTETMRSHTRGIRGFEYSKSPKVIGSWGNERFAILWDPTVGKPLQALHGHISRIVGLKFSPESENMVFTYAEDGSIRVWDLRTYRSMQQIRERAWDTIGAPGAIFYNSARQAIITGTQRLYWKDAIISKFADDYVGHTKSIQATSYCTKEQFLCSCDEISIRLWNMANDSLVVWWHQQPLNGVCLDQNGHSILVDKAGEDLRVISTTNGELVTMLVNSKPEDTLEDNHEPRFLFWGGRKMWIVASSRWLHFYDHCLDFSKIAYPEPTCIRTLHSLPAFPTMLLVVGDRLAMGLANGDMNTISLRFVPRHADEILSVYDRRCNDSKMISFLPGDLHYEVRPMIQKAQHVSQHRELASEVTATVVPEALAKQSSTFASLDKLSLRIEAAAVLNNHYIVASDGLGYLTIWDIPGSCDVVRWSVVLHQKVAVPCVEAVPDGCMMFYGDEMGYCGTFRIHLPEDENEAFKQQYIQRLALFRVTEASVSTIRYIPERDILSIGCSDSYIRLTTTTGGHLKVLGSTALTHDPAPHSAQYLEAASMHRKECIMRILDDVKLTEQQIIAKIHEFGGALFKTDQEIHRIIMEMSPTDPAKDPERLLDYDEVSKTYHSLLMNDDSYLAHNKQPASSMSTPVASAIAASTSKAPLSDIWIAVDGALETPLKPKPFRLHDAEHLALVAQLTPGEGTKTVLEPLELAPDATPSIDRSHLKPLHQAPSGFSLQQEEGQTKESQENLNETVIFEADVESALKSVPSWRATRPEKCPRFDQVVDREHYFRCLMREEENELRLNLELDVVQQQVEVTFESFFNDFDFQGRRLLVLHARGKNQVVGIFEPETSRRGIVLRKEGDERNQLREKEQKARVVVMRHREGVNLVRYLTMDDIYSTEEGDEIATKTFFYYHTRGETLFPLDISSTYHRAKAPSLLPRRSQSAHGREKPQQRRRAASQQSTFRHEKSFITPSWRVNEPFHHVSESDPLCWSNLLALTLEWMPFNEDLHVSRARRVQSISHCFSEKCKMLVEQVVEDWSCDDPTVQVIEPFVWHQDGVVIHCVTNPVAGRLCGSLANATKMAQHELNSLNAFMNAQEGTPLRIHTPLACIVEYWGLTFYCSSLLPVRKGDEVFFHEKRVANDWLNKMHQQAFHKLHLDSSLKPVCIPHSYRRFQNSAGMIYSIGFRHLFPPHFNTSKLIQYCPHLLRVELVRASVNPLASNVYDSTIPISERRKEDKAATKSARRLQSLILELATDLLKIDTDVTQFAHGKIVKYLHEKGLNVLYIIQLAFTLDRMIRQEHLLGPKGNYTPEVRQGIRIGRPRSINDEWVRKVVSFSPDAKPTDELFGASLVYQYLIEEAVVRTFKRLLLQRIRQEAFYLIDCDETGKPCFSVATYHHPTNPDIVPKKHMARQTLIKHIVKEMLLDLLGRTPQSHKFWNEVLAPAMRACFPFGEFKSFISMEEVQLSRVLQRFTQKVGIGFDVEREVVNVDALNLKVLHFDSKFDLGWHVANKALVDGMSMVLNHDEKCQRALGESPELVSVCRYQMMMSVRQHSVMSSKALQAEETIFPLIHKFYGEASPLIPWVMQLQAQMELTAGRQQEALSLLMDSVNLLRKAFGEQHPVVLMALDTLVEMLTTISIPSEAVRIAMKVLLAKRGAINSHPNWFSNVDIADGLCRAGNIRLGLQAETVEKREVRDMFVEAYRINSKIYPSKTSELVVESLRKLAFVHLHINEDVEAIELLTQLLEIQKVESGKYSSEVACVHDDLGEVHLARLDFTSALNEFNSGLSVRTRAFGLQAPELAISHRHIGSVLFRQNQQHEALRVLNSASRLLNRAAYNDPSVLETLEALAEGYRLGGHYKHAVETLLKVLDACERTLGPLHPRTAHMMTEIGLLFYLDGRFHEAWHCFDVCCSMLVKMYGEKHPSVGKVKIHLARCEGAMGNVVESTNLFNAGLAVLDEQLVKAEVRGRKELLYQFPLIRAQLLVDIGAMLLTDAKTFEHRQEEHIDVNRLKAIGMNNEKIMAKALSFFTESRTVIVQAVQDPTHPALKVIDAFIKETEERAVESRQAKIGVTKRQEKTKIIEQWSMMSEDTRREKDPMWYRNKHKVFKLKSYIGAREQAFRDAFVEEYEQEK